MKSWWLNTSEGHTTLIAIIRIVMKGNPERIILKRLDSVGPLHHCWIKNNSLHKAGLTETEKHSDCHLHNYLNKIMGLYIVVKKLCV